MSNESKKNFEWRVCWHGGVVGSDGAGDWEPYDGDKQNEDEVNDDLNTGVSGGRPSLAEESFWNLSGAEFWVEVREGASDAV